MVQHGYKGLGHRALECGTDGGFERRFRCPVGVSRAFLPGWLSFPSESCHGNFTSEPPPPLIERL